MAAIYPTAIKTFSARHNFTQVVDAGDVNQAYDEISAVQTTLGTNPNQDTIDGSVKTWGTVKASINSARRGLSEPVCRVTATNVKVSYGDDLFPGFTSKQVDTHGMWQGGSSLVVPRAGFYTFSAYIRWNKDGANVSSQVQQFNRSGKLQLAISTGDGATILTGETHYFPQGWQELTRSSCTTGAMFFAKDTLVHLNLWQTVLKNTTLFATAFLSAVYHRDPVSANNI